MQRGRSVLVIAGVVVCAFTGAVLAEGTPSAKATAQAGSINVLEATNMPWQTILSGSLKTSSQKDLFVGVSMECGLLTRTLVSSKNGKSDASSAEAAVKVRVMVDGQLAYPGEVTYCKRTQELTATFQGIIADCLSVDPITGGIVLDETCVQPEELELVLGTMNANGYTYLMDDVGTGVHSVQVQARIETNTSFEAGSAEAMATIGKGSMTVEEVRLIKDEEIEIY